MAPVTKAMNIPPVVRIGAALCSDEVLLEPSEFALTPAV
jgi:hypothetical protein